MKRRSACFLAERWTHIWCVPRRAALRMQAMIIEYGRWLFTNLIEMMYQNHMLFLKMWCSSSPIRRLGLYPLPFGLDVSVTDLCSKTVKARSAKVRSPLPHGLEHLSWSPKPLYQELRLPSACHDVRKHRAGPRERPDRGGWGQRRRDAWLVLYCRSLVRCLQPGPSSPAPPRFLIHRNHER